MSKVDLDELRGYVTSRTPHENMLAVVEELALARAVVEAALETYQKAPIFDGPVPWWVDLGKALAAYRAKVGGDGNG